MQLRNCAAVVLLALASALPSRAQDTVSQWRRWEKTIASSKDFTTGGGNPYRDLVLRVKFTASTGSTFTQDAFWEGSASAPRNFKVRAALPPGSWAWQIDSCTGTTGGQSCATGTTWTPSSGTITVTASTGSGVRLYDRGRPTQLISVTGDGQISRTPLYYQDLSQPFFWAADTAWTAPPREIHGDTAVWASYLADRKAKGFTVVLTAPALAWSGAGQSWPSLPAAAGFSFDTLAGCSSTAPLPNDCSKPRPAYWQAFEQMVEQANQADLLVVVVGVADPVGLGDATHPFPNPANAEDFARYLAARLAGNHVIYSPGFDTRLDLTTQNGTSTASLMQTVGSALAAASPRQLVTNHLAGRSLCTDYQSFATGSSWMTFYLFQSGHATGGMGTAGQACPGPLATETAVQTAMRRAREMPLTLSAYTGPKLPATNGEGPYDAFSYDPTNPVDNRYRVRQAGYLSSLSNSMGFSYGASRLVFWDLPARDLTLLSNGDMNLLFSRFRNRSGLFPRPAWILNQPADPLHEQKPIRPVGLSCSRLQDTADRSESTV
ncbi:MAG: DUF4038 domain-containing protein [Thermoanaerobaculia bacterium]